MVSKGSLLEQRYGEQEAAADARRRARSGRQVLILLALVDALVLGTGLTAMVDLRRLQTPGGTALRWTQAAVFGDCDDYLSYSVGDRSGGDSRTSGELCRDLRASTAQARADSIRIGLALGPVVQQARAAQVEVVLTRDRKPVHVPMRLVQVGGRWKVVRDGPTCAAVGCA